MNNNFCSSISTYLNYFASASIIPIQENDIEAARPIVRDIEVNIERMSLCDRRCISNPLSTIKKGFLIFFTAAFFVMSIPIGTLCIAIGNEEVSFLGKCMIAAAIGAAIRPIYLLLRSACTH